MRRVANAVILDGPAAHLLSRAADLNKLRIAARVNHDHLYALLLDIQYVAMSYERSREGTKPPASEEIDDASSGEFTTVARLASRARVSPRTIRNHISRGLLRANQHDRVWIIRTEDANAYIAGRQPA